jgi:hypothetical protein
MQLKLTDIPEEIIIEYKLHEMATTDMFIVKFEKECMAYLKRE